MPRDRLLHLVFCWPPFIKSLIKTWMKVDIYKEWQTWPYELIRGHGSNSSLEHAPIITIARAPFWNISLEKIHSCEKHDNKNIVKWGPILALKVGEICEILRDGFPLSFFHQFWCLFWCRMPSHPHGHEYTTKLALPSLMNDYYSKVGEKLLKIEIWQHNSQSSLI